MNRLEAKTILDVSIDYKNTGKTREGINRTQESIFSWRDFSICFDGGKYTIINGQIPNIVSKILFTDYPQYRNGLRVDGVYEDLNPNLIKNNTINKLEDIYVSTCKVGTKEGLINLLSELSYYYDNGIYTTEQRKPFYERQKVIIKEVDKRLLEFGHPYPYKSSEAWLKDYGIDTTVYCQESKDLLQYIKAFDETVNPFCNPGYEINLQGENMHNISFTSEKDITDRNGTSLKMLVSKGSSLVSHKIMTYEETQYVEYELYYDSDSKRTMHVNNTIEKANKDNTVSLFSMNVNDKELYLTYTYNLRTGCAYMNFDAQSPITRKNTEIMIKELVKATAAAKEVTLDNMAKPIEEKTFQKKIIKI